MAETNTVPLTEGWTALSEGEANVLVQLDSQHATKYPVYVAVAESEPAASDKGISLTDRDRTASFGDLDETDIVYARTGGGEASVVVVRG